MSVLGSNTVALLVGLLLGGLVAWYLVSRLLARRHHLDEVRWVRHASDLRAECDEHQSRLQKLQTHATSREATLAQALAESEETLALLSDEKLPAFERELNGRNERIKELEQELAVQRARVADAVDELQTLERRVSEADAELAGRAQRIDELSEHASAVEQQLSQLASRTRKELGAGEERLQAQSLQLAELDNEVSTLRAQLDRSESQLAAALADNESLVQRQHSDEERVRQLNKTISDQHEQVTLSNSQAESDRQSSQLQRQRSARLEEQLGEARAERERLDAQMAQQSARLEQLGARVSSANATIEAMRAAEKERDDRIAELVTAARSRDEQLQRLNAENRQLHADAATAQQKLASAQETIDELRERVRQYEQHMPDYESELRRRDNRLAALDRDFKALRKKLPALNDAIRERETSIEDLVAELARQRERYASLRERMSAASETPKPSASRAHAKIIELNQHLADRTRSTAVLDSQTPGRSRRAVSSPPWCLDAPRGTKDDLKRIHGIGPVIERKLNGLGIFHFHQLAQLQADDIDWVATHMQSLRTRISRDNWIEQARKLSADTPEDRRSGG